MTVYFVQSTGDPRAPVKVGSSEMPDARLASLQTGHPERLRILATLGGGKKLEHAIHQALGFYRGEGEWFDASDEVLAFALVNGSQWARDRDGGDDCHVSKVIPQIRCNAPADCLVYVREHGSAQVCRAHESLVLRAARLLRRLQAGQP